MTNQDLRFELYGMKLKVIINKTLNKVITMVIACMFTKGQWLARCLTGLLK
ncbi:hypothetical protein D3C80_1700840 [compost metagenome]